MAVVGGALAVAPLAGVDIVKKLTLNKKIEEQQYRCAVMKFYLDSLGEMCIRDRGMRVGEMVLLNREDINFNERECVVFGKGDKERIAVSYTHLDVYKRQLQMFWKRDIQSRTLC